MNMDTYRMKDEIRRTHVLRFSVRSTRARAVWLDVTDPAAGVPLYNGYVFIKAARISREILNDTNDLTIGNDEDEVAEDFKANYFEVNGDGSKSDDEIIRPVKSQPRPPAPSMVDELGDGHRLDDDKVVESGNKSKLQRHSSDDLLIPLESQDSNSLDLTPLKVTVNDHEDLMSELFTTTGASSQQSGKNEITSDATDFSSLF